MMVEREQVHVLVYLDVGMDNTSYMMTYGRLAPVQAMTWGHPATSGWLSVE